MLAASGCGSSASTARPLVTAGDDTTLGVGDVFDVRVYGDADLAATYRIAQDGTIDYPLVGRLAVAGLEPTAVADLLETRLRDGQYLVDPQVSIFVKEYNSKRVVIMGAVARPGNFPMTGGLTVVQAISLAGGFSPIASRDDTVVSRRVDGRLRRFRVRVDDVTDGRAADFPLRNGDIIFVPERVF